MQEKTLRMYGGMLGGLVPLAVLVIGLIWLSVAGRGGTKPFWACAWLALTVGLFFARDKTEYCKAAMRGIGDKTGIVIVTAWLFAGVFGKLMAAGGLVNGLLWLGMTTGRAGRGLHCAGFPGGHAFRAGHGHQYGHLHRADARAVSGGLFSGSGSGHVGLAFLSGAAFGVIWPRCRTRPLFPPIRRAQACARWCAAVFPWP